MPSSLREIQCLSAVFKYLVETKSITGAFASFLCEILISDALHYSSHPVDRDTYVGQQLFYFEQNMLFLVKFNLEFSSLLKQLEEAKAT